MPLWLTAAIDAVRFLYWCFSNKERVKVALESHPLPLEENPPPWKAENPNEE